jgi:hypothetical protein
LLADSLARGDTIGGGLSSRSAGAADSIQRDSLRRELVRRDTIRRDTDRRGTSRREGVGNRPPTRGR